MRTAPLILAARQSPRLRRLLNEGAGDCGEIVKIVVEEGGLEMAREVANEHADKALKAVEGWRESDCKKDLQEIVKICIDRNM